MGWEVEGGVQDGGHMYTHILMMRKHKEIKETILFTIAMKRIKYLGINLPKERKKRPIYRKLQNTDERNKK